MTTKFHIIEKGDDLNKAILAITKAGKALDNNIQIAATSALWHLSKHGDVGFVNRLYLGVSKGVRKAALTSWMLAHGSLVANTEQSKTEKPFNYTKDKTTNVEAAMADPWFNHKPDAAPDEVYDLQKAINVIIAKASKAKQLVHGELVASLQALVVNEPVVTGDDSGDEPKQGE